MKIRVILLFLLFILTLPFLLRSFASKISIINPLPLKTYAEAPAPINSPTPQPSIAPTLAPTKPPTPTVTPFPTPLLIVSPTTLNDSFVKYSKEYAVDIELLKKIAKCESGFNSAAINKIYTGLYQFTESLWITTRTLMGTDPNPDLRLNAEESIKTAAFMISRNQQSVWPNCK